jgi:hypothetical protein
MTMVSKILSDVSADSVSIVSQGSCLAMMNPRKDKLLGLLRRHPKVAEVIRKSLALLHVAIVIPVAAASEKNDLQCSEIHADPYIAGLVDPDEFLKSMEIIDSFWMLIADLPRETSS